MRLLSPFWSPPMQVWVYDHPTQPLWASLSPPPLRGGWKPTSSVFKEQTALLVLGVGRLWSTTQRISRTVISPILENRREKVGCLTLCLWLSWSAWFVFHLNVGYSALPVGFLFALLTVIGDSLPFHLTSIPFNYCILMLVFVSVMLSTFCMLSVLIIVLITHLRVIYFVQLLRNDYSHTIIHIFIELI